MKPTNTIETELRAGFNILLVGPPGCGKTARIAAAAEAIGRKLVVLRLSTLDRVDVSGAIVPDTRRGVARLLPLEAVARAREEGAILFLDDFAQAPFDVQAAAMRLYEEGFQLVGATNRPQDGAGVCMLEPWRSRWDATYVVPTSPNDNVLANRLHDYEDEVETWCRWAERQGAHPSITAWHRLGGQGEQWDGIKPVLYAWRKTPDPAVRMPDYRAWGTLIKRWNLGPEFRTLQATAAVVGPEQAQGLLAYHSSAASLPTVDDLANGAPIPGDPAKLLFVSSLLLARLNRNPRDLPMIIGILDRMHITYAAMVLRAAVANNKDLAMQRELHQWISKHKDILDARF